METVQELKELLDSRHILNRYHLRRLGVFGSFARAQQAHDIDLLVEDDISGSQAIALQLELEEATGKHVDLVLEKFANPIILYRARKDLIYV